MQTKRLADFLTFLDGRTAEDFRSTAVDDYFQKYRIASDDLKPFTHFREDTYARNLIHRTGLYEFMMIAWQPDQRTPIHDHYGQRCWMVLQQGTLTFKNFKPAPADDSPLIVDGPCTSQKAGDAIYIDDGIGVHSIANASRETAVSLHLYAGPIPRCRIYSEANRRFEWKVLEYYTTPEKVLGTFSGIKAKAI